MAKKIYSIVVEENLIIELDKKASTLCVSRSQFIEKLLANELSFKFSSNFIDNVIEKLSELIVLSNFTIMQSPNYMVSFMTKIDYKYNPAIKYTLAFNPNSNNLANLKISMRAKSAGFKLTIQEFFNCFIDLESSHTRKREFSTSQEDFNLTLNLPINSSDAKIANLIYDYVACLDYLLKFYFSLDNANDFSNQLFKQCFLSKIQMIKI